MHAFFMQNYSYIPIQVLLVSTVKYFREKFLQFSYFLYCDHSMKSKTVSLHCGYADAKILAKYISASEISTLISLINVKSRLLILKKKSTLYATLGGIASICFRYHFQQTLRIQIQGSQGCQKIRKIVRNQKLPIARSTSNQISIVLILIFE